jgi:hypothetical protein
LASAGHHGHCNKNLGGVIKFLPAFGLGLLVSLIAGIAYALGWEIYLATTLSPGSSK